MESLETADLLELMYTAYEAVDVQFQAWMAITFAAIVAVYTGRSDLGITLRSTIASGPMLQLIAIASGPIASGPTASGQDASWFSFLFPTCRLTHVLQSQIMALPICQACCH